MSTFPTAGKPMDAFNSKNVLPNVTHDGWVNNDMGNQFIRFIRSNDYTVCTLQHKLQSGFMNNRQKSKSPEPKQH